MSELGLVDSLWPQCLRWFDVTQPTAEGNLALDEALLLLVDTDVSSACLRFWQPSDYFVVLGRSNDASREVNLDACRMDHVPIVRRGTGGGAVVVGPGCLCYSLVLPATDLHRSLGISHVTSRLMTRTAAGLMPEFAGIEFQGTSDLTRGGLKFSGNAQRWLRRAFIHHGTLLYDFDLTRIGRYLAHPSREPAYRLSRSHRDFVTNIATTPQVLMQSMALAWNAAPSDCPEIAIEEATRIVAARYNSPEWKIG